MDFRIVLAVVVGVCLAVMLFTETETMDEEYKKAVNNRKEGKF